MKVACICTVKWCTNYACWDVGALERNSSSRSAIEVMAMARRFNFPLSLLQTGFVAAFAFDEASFAGTMVVNCGHTIVDPCMGP